MRDDERYDSLIRFYAERYGRDPRQVKRQIRVESAFDPNARSSAGCVGLAQFGALTWSQWWDGDADLESPPSSVEQKFERTNPELSIRNSCAYMRALERRFGSLIVALAAYNWGPGNVARWAADALGIEVLPRETRDYIAKCLDFESETVGGG